MKNPLLIAIALFVVWYLLAPKKKAININAV